MGVSAKVQDPGIFQTFWNYFIKEKTTERVHGLMDWVHALGSWCTDPKLIPGHRLMDLR
jgi:hypothetical protein